MKKLFIISMAVFLLMNSIGYTVYAHFCNDELMQTSLIVNIDEACCSDEGNESTAEESSNTSCCEEEGILLVIKDQFLKSELNSKEFIQLAVIENNFLQLNTINSTSRFHENELRWIKDPPRINTPDKSILHSVFRI